MAQAGKLHQANRIAFVSNVPTLLPSGKREDLATEQIGLFYRDLGKQSVATTSPTDSKGRKFKLIQGTVPVDPEDYTALKYAGIPFWQHETIEFEADDIVEFKGIKGKPYTKEEIVAIGYDGVDIKKTLKAPKRDSVNYFVHLFGFPAHMVANSTSRSLKRQYYIEPDPAPCSDCEDQNCSGQCEYQKCQVIADKLIAQIKADKFHKIPMTRLIKPTKITKCVTPEEAPEGLVSYKTFEIEIPDDQSDAAFGKLQAAYPGEAIKRVRKGAVYTTYRVTRLASANALADFTTSGLKKLTDCEDCPCNYTKVPGAAVYELTVPAGKSVPNVPDQISRIKLAGNDDRDVYQYIVPASKPEADVMAVFANANLTNVFSLGIQRDLCVPEESATYSWCETETGKKAPKLYYITVMDTKCGESRLPELQAAYPDSDVAEHIVGTCVRQYKMTVMSNLVTDEDCTTDSFTWTTPEPFAFNNWETPKDPEPQSGCACGVWLEGARFEEIYTPETFPYLGYDSRMNDPVHIRVSRHSEDFTQPLAYSEDDPFTILQEADMPINQGRAVVEIERESMGYFLKTYDFHPVIREKFGKKFNAKLDVYYDEYQLRIRHNHRADGFFGFTGPQEIIYRFFFPVGEGKSFESTINKLVAASDATRKNKQVVL